MPDHAYIDINGESNDMATGPIERASLGSEIVL